MARDRRAKDLEDLRGENRQLQKMVKHLKKQLARAEKNNKKIEDLYEAPEPEMVEPEVKVVTSCFKCGAKAELIDIGKMGKMLICTKDNTHRKRIK
jgi:cell division septum initiation protein DivIVA